MIIMKTKFGSQGKQNNRDFLEDYSEKGETLCFLPEKLKYTVGRVGADLELQNDTCVSRAHALFHLIKNNSELSLKLEDVGSKYGTFYNDGIEKNSPLEKGHKIPLKDNDLIRFGRFENVWKVQSMQINTVTSALSNEDNENVASHVKILGGKIQEQWSSSSTHLTMREPSITVKFLHALLDQKYIVTPDYWKDLLHAVQNKKNHLPKPELYAPGFGDVNVGSNPERRHLFDGTTFVFLNRKHVDMYGPIVKAAGGVCKDINSGVQKTLLIKSKVVVVQYTPSTQTQSSETISTIAEFLESNSKRIIPEYEIGLAILHCSIEKFCNPCYKMTQTMADNSQHGMNVDLTDEQDSIDTQSLDLVIPETNESIQRNSQNNTREDESMPNMVVTETPASMENIKKRKLMGVDFDKNDDGDLFQFQSKKSCMEGNNEANDKSSQKVNDVDGGVPSTSAAKTTKNLFNTFLQKSQTKTNRKSQMTSNESEELSSANKESRKRAHIQVLDENDEGGDDDLFSFGDTQKTKKARPSLEPQNQENDLFNFVETGKTVDVDNDDSNDMIPTQQFVVPEKPIRSKSSIQMPKPKLLPRTVSAVDWLTGSMGKIRIKNENSTHLKNEEGEDIIKTESDIKAENDINITDDHRKWLDSLKDAIEIQQVALNNTMKMNEKSHYKFKNRMIDNAADNFNANKNFKTFVKKYSHGAPQNSSVIKLHLR